MTTENGLVGTVAIVGFPNVGKSTLVNRLTGTRAAVVHETPGVTRDRKELVCEWNGKQFLLIDTGGVDIADATPMTRAIVEQARAAVAEADLRLRRRREGGITPGDEEIAQILRSRTNRRLDREQDRRSGAGLLAYDLHASGSADLIPLRRTGTAPATRSTRCSSCPRHRQAASRRGGDSGRDPRPSERGQVVAAERVPRR